jgi:hypothetical protein
MLDSLVTFRQESGVSVRVFLLSGMAGLAAGIRHGPRWAKLRLVSFHGLLAALSLLLSSVSWGSPAAETNSPPPAAISIADTNSQALLQAYLQLQEQLRATQLAIEQNRQEIKAAAAQSAESLSKALESIQESFAAQRARDLEAMQKSNKLMLIVVSAFAAMGFLTLLMMSYFQWRMSKGLAEISAAVPAALGLGLGSAAGALGSAGQLNLRLPGVTQYHESRGSELPQSASPSSKHQGAPNRAAELRLIHDPVTSLRRRRIRPLRTMAIVGLIFAAALAVLFYVVTYKNLGFDYLHDMFKS